MKAQKLNEMIRKGEPAVPVEEVEIAPAEYEKYLTLVYKAEKFPKRGTSSGLAKTLPAPEMEKLFFDPHPGERQRPEAPRFGAGRNVKDFISNRKKVTSDRLFVVEPNSLAPTKKGTALQSRVEFKLK